MREVNRLSSQLNLRSLATTSIEEAMISILEKFNRKRSNFWRFLQHINLYLSLQASQYFDGFNQVRFIDAFFFESVVSWFALFMEKDLLLFYDLNSFLEVFMATFRKNNWKK